MIQLKKIDWKANKKSSELVFARFFIERLNQNYNLNYHVIPDNEDVSDVDIQAIAKDHRALNLQLKTGEPGLEQFWGTRIKQGSGMAIIDGNIEELLAQIIKDGEQHYANTENLILLITERYQPVFDENYALYISKKLMDTTFKGIYLVKLAAFDNIHPYEGQIVGIKDIFGNHGKTF